MTTSIPNPAFDQVLTEADLALSRETGWADVGWFFSRARCRILAARFRALPKEAQNDRMDRALRTLNDDTLPGGTAQAWFRVLQGGTESVCQVLEDTTDGTQSQVLRTSIPAPLWEGLMTEDERLELMARVRQKIGIQGAASRE